MVLPHVQLSWADSDLEALRKQKACKVDALEQGGHSGNASPIPRASGGMAGQALALRPVARRATGSWEARCPGPTHTQPVRSRGVAVSGHQHGFHFPRRGQCPAKPRDPCLEQQTRQHPGRALHQGERPFHQKLETKLFCSLGKKKKAEVPSPRMLAFL